MTTKVTYEDYYRQWDEVSRNLWSDKSRMDYKADYWYNLNRNSIVRDMIGDRWDGLEILATGTGTGAAQWADNAILDSIPCVATKTNIVDGEGVDVVCDACDLPFDEESFDAILCREVIEHVPQDFALMFEARRVLRKGGWLLLTTPNGFNCMPNGKDHVRAYSPFNLISLVEEYKFTVVEKRGNLPNVMTALLPLCKQGYQTALDEFKRLSEMWHGVEESYYFGGELYILARKGE